MKNTFLRILCTVLTMLLAAALLGGCMGISGDPTDTKKIGDPTLPAAQLPVTPILPAPPHRERKRPVPQRLLLLQSRYLLTVTA